MSASHYAIEPWRDRARRGLLLIACIACLSPGSASALRIGGVDFSNWEPLDIVGGVHLSVETSRNLLLLVPVGLLSDRLTLVAEDRISLESGVHLDSNDPSPCHAGCDLVSIHEDLDLVVRILGPLGDVRLSGQNIVATVEPIPEPGTLGLLAVGLMALSCRARERRSRRLGAGSIPHPSVAASVVALVLLVTLPAAGDDAKKGWEHARSTSGVEVYTRDVPGSTYKQFRATGVVPAPLAHVVSWWRDPTTFTQWINSCVEARHVDAGDGAVASYLKFDFPFPASDRDVVLRAVEIEADAQRVVMESRNLDGVVPPVAGLVRMPMMLGRWEFTALDPGTTQVIYRQHMDAGGSLPAFVVNRATVDNPIGTLLGLARYAVAQRGR